MSYFALTPAQRELADYMSDLSEMHHFACWLDGLEFALWDFMKNGAGPFGLAHVDPRALARLNQLSAACGGWIVWRDEDESETFLPMDEWLKLYEAHERQVTPCG